MATTVATITFTVSLSFLASVKAQPQHASIPPPPTAPGKPDLPPLPTPPTNQLTPQPAFSVVIDAAHGGANLGARMANNLVEKNISLELSSGLRTALAAHGIPVVMTRDSDADISVNQRAGIANHALASACLVLHATATGSGVHLFTSSLPTAMNAPPTSPTSAFVPWQSAQGAWITRSLRLSSEINSAFGKAAIPTTLGVASIAPLDNLACPAVAIEVAPLTNSTAKKDSSVSAGKYHQQIIDALTSAILEWRTDWKQQP